MSVHPEQIKPFKCVFTKTQNNAMKVFFCQEKKSIPDLFLSQE